MINPLANLSHEIPTQVSTRVWSPYQQAVFNAIVNGEGNGVIDAVAGSGKSTTLIQALKLWRDKNPTKRALFVAFNKSIADELKTKVPNGVDAATLHSVCFKSVVRAFRGIRVDDRKTFDYAGQVVSKLDKNVQFDAKSDLSRAYSLAKSTMTDLSDTPVIGEMVAAYGLTLKYSALVLPLLSKLDELMRADTTRCVFDEMLSFVIDHKLAPAQQYDLVCVDECFPKETPVLLADGSTRTIGDIVNTRLKVKVLSYDEKTGKQVEKRVIDWKKIIHKKKMVRLVVQQIDRKKDGNKYSLKFLRARYGQRTLVCTEDHRIFSNGKWVEAAKLKAGNPVQLENRAPRDSSYNHKFKHGISGKQILRKKLSNRKMPRSSTYNRLGPISRGGNGREFTEPQKELLRALGKNWVAEYPVPTRKPRGGIWPTCFKVDIANPWCKVAIEVDGPSHNIKSRQRADRRRDRLLRSFGWRVIRIKNRDALRRADEIAATIPECIVEAEIVSVEPHEMEKHSYVYDLTVEDTHCYYAHGILVHNCQDMNVLQIELLKGLVKTGGRLWAVGDPWQSCYLFRGADADAMARIKRDFSVPAQNELPLSITYRCPRLVVAEAQDFVHHIQASETAIEGAVVHAERNAWRKTLMGLNAGTSMVICRRNAPLVGCALFLVSQGRKATVRGRDIGKGLQKIIRDLDGRHNGTISDLAAALDQHLNSESLRLIAREKFSQAQQLEDKIETIQTLLVGTSAIDGLMRRIDNIFVDQQDGIVLSSVHKSKGLEAETVVWIEPEFGSFLQGKAQERGDMASAAQETNLMYIAITRAKHTLVYQPLPDRENEE